MLDISAYPEKWLRMSSIVAQYPAISLVSQYKYLVIKRLIVGNIFACLLQYICLMTSTLLPTTSLAWLATGVACGMLFLRGYRVLTGIWLGCFFTYYLASHQLILSCLCATVFAMQAYLLTWITRRYISPLLVFYHVNKLLIFSLVSAGLTAITSFILIWLCDQPFSLWLEWWLANFNGVLIVSIAWVATDTFYTYGGKSFNSHTGWCKTSRWAFVIAFLLDTWIYLTAPELPGFTLLALQLALCLGTLISLFASL
jgi:integral membrane sensor domain MASE1